MIQFIIGFFLFITIIIILTIIHELGHFLFAKLFGIKVDCFSIGFGKKIYSLYDKSGTEYSISMIPLGGYVRMFGEPSSNLISSKNNENFNNAKIWKRLIIIISGPIFNFIFSIILYWIIFFVGIINYKPIVYDVVPNSISENYGINKNMEIKSINNIKTYDWNDVRIQLIKNIGKSKVNVEVFNNNKKIFEKKILNLKKLNFKNLEKDPIDIIGILIKNKNKKIIINKIKKESLAEKIGLKIGDRIFKINNILLLNWKNFKKNIKFYPYKINNISIIRNKAKIKFFFNKKIYITYKKKIVDTFGIKTKSVFIKHKNKVLYKLNLFESFIESIKKTWNLIIFIINILKQIILGNISLNNLNGPIYIAKTSTILVKYGLIYYLMFLSLISINLGVINLIPIPILDGGQILLLFIEKIIRKPISKKYQNLIYKLSTIVLIILSSIAIFNDLYKI